MYTLLLLTFVVGYFCIALEHPLKIDKTASALLTGVLCWTVLVMGQEALFPGGLAPGLLEETILLHVGEIAEILFFLLGAMTIVELIDTHGGFQVITERIRTTDRVKLLWILGFVTFFLSAVLDNLTTTIVMATLLKKLIRDKEDLWFFGGMVVIAANAGGAWSPIGDVTTIMLWIGGQVTAPSIVAGLLLPSIACLLAPLAVLSFTKRGSVSPPSRFDLDNGGGGLHHQPVAVSPGEASLVLWLGIIALLFVPVFKTVTHLPPFMGMLLSLGVLWVVTELLHKRKPEDERHSLSVAGVIRRVDTPSILFFLGILLAVASLQTAGHLSQMAVILNDTFGNIYVINLIIGLVSAIVDNVPLVAGAMGMYSLADYPQDSNFWTFLAYCAGTGGSSLIIGSAAGVAIMGLLKIDFIWYLKRITWLALVGYFAGAVVYYLQHGL
ncbi:Na+/H+ antiporter NhaD/arsenite permease-like protein [Lewinella marina]|uniref:Sodium:proton antiporter n=1 Tax=Neolewinella marina TaxID=438751 RepID=A0A2G0CB77_9BACT|nr:sodium:proton antiporter NhaD [Neolewinella marina]NJB87751.1 Na+/H+ antiporter NhaD/arsenite permease-like protein [Neolewinella marina]PHK97223.1 sodium:proton antiporter [Neolewinella marina]